MSKLIFERPFLISPNLDIFCFLSYLPIVLITPFFSYFGIDPMQLTITQGVLLIILVDGAHVFSTIFVTYFDKERRDLFRTYLIGIPLMVFTFTLCSLYFLGSMKFYIFLAYAAIFHFMRQQYGWFAIACKKGQRGPVWISSIDQLSIYSIPIFAVIWKSSYSDPQRWFKTGDLFLIPTWLTDKLHLVFWFITALFILSNLYQIIKLSKINLTKYMIWINTFVSWYIGFVYFNEGFVFLFLLVLHHGLPYLGLIYKTERVTKPIRNQKFKYIFALTAMYLVCVGLSWTEISTPKPFIEIEPATIEHFLSIAFLALIFTPQVSHYLIDMVIWKKKYKILKYH